MARRGKMKRRAAKAVPQVTSKATGDLLTREQRGLLARINPEGLKALKILAVQRDTTLQALLIEAANDLLSKYGQRPVARNPLLD